LSALSTSQPQNNQTHQPSNGEENIEHQIRKEAVQELVYQLFQQQHPKKQLVLIRVIAKLVNSRIIEVRFVCEFMLNNLFFLNQSAAQSQVNNQVSQANPGQQSTAPPVKLKSLKETSTFIWCKVLEFIQKLIPSLDYKSCRDIFKMLLEVVKKVPHSNSSVPPPLENESNLPSSIGSTRASKHKLLDFEQSASHQIELLNSSRLTDDIKLESLFQTVSYLLDQENYFMPRYLAINEIKSVLTFGKESYHPVYKHINILTFIYMPNLFLNFVKPIEIPLYIHKFY